MALHLARWRPSRVLARHYVSRQEVYAAYPPFRILFFGSDQFASQSLVKLHKKRAELASDLEVVVPPPRPKGRGLAPTPVHVATTAKDLGIKTHEVPPQCDFKMNGFELPGREQYDIGVVASFGYFIPQHIIESFRYGMINIHPSLLPKYRGASPIQYALLNGDKVTGVSIIQVHPTLIDAGSILHQVQYPISRTDTFGTLYRDLADTAAQALADTLSIYGRKVERAYPQLEAGDKWENYPKAPKLTADMAKCDFGYTAERLYNRFRALKGFLNTPSFAMYNGRKISFLEMIPPRSNSEFLMEGVGPGVAVFDMLASCVWVAATDGCIGVTRVLLDGKTMEAAEFAARFMKATRVKFD